MVLEPGEPLGHQPNLLLNHSRPFSLSIIQKSIPFFLPSQTIVGEYICIFKMYLKNSNFQIGRLYTFKLIMPKEFPQSLPSNKFVNFPLHYGFMVFTSSQNRRLTQYSAVKRQATSVRSYMSCKIVACAQLWVNCMAGTLRWLETLPCRYTVCVSH